MKKILFFIIAVVVSVQVNATRKYVATTGSNAADGSIGTPWQTVAYACTQAVSGDTIMIAAGAYNEGTNLMNKPVGVSIMGVMSGSDTTHIISTNQSTSEYEAAITCKSTTGISTYDNSSISYIKLTGSNLTAFQAIYIGYRSGIKIHNCVIKDFYTSGIGINGSMTSYPNLYLTGIEIYNNVIKNCAGWATLGGVPDANGSSIRIRGTDGIKIHDNLLDNRSRPTGENGETISLYRNKNHQIYNNTFYRNNHEVTSGGTRRWNFFVEEWNYRGNGQFYNNTLYGLAQFSIGGDDNLITSGCSYGYKIYGNQFLNPANGNKFNNGTEVTLFAICVEGGGHNLVEVYKNYIQRYGVGVEISTPTSDPAGFWKESWIMENVKVHYNIIENIGYADNQYGALAIWLINETMVSPYYNTFNNILIANNVITGDNGGTYRGYAGIYVNINGNWTGLNIHNNIATGFSQRGIYIYEHSTDGLNLSNSNATYNVMYNNTTSNLVYIENTINQTNVDVTSGNLTSDPLFVGGSPYSYKLTASSPAKDAGISVGLTSDYGGYSVPVGSAPDIGAWEYGADVTPPNWYPQGIGWDPMYQKHNFRDSVNFTRGFMIAGVPISASGSGLEILGGLTATVNDLNNTSGSTGNLQGQINTKLNISDTASMLSNYPIKPEVSGEINDTIEARLAAASVGLVVQDYEGGSTGNDYYMTPDQVRSYIVSSGGGLNGQILKFIVGTTSGAPTTADSTLTHANFGGKHLDVYRDGALAYYNGAIAANLNEGFRLNSNTITVNPLWQDNEQVEVRILDPIAWTDLSLSGEESSLLTGLSAYWKLDETSGSVADDATDTQDATIFGSPSRVPTQSGLGYGIRFNDDAHVMAIESPVAALDLDTTFSVSFWMYLDSVPSASARAASYIMYGANLTTPTSSQRIYIPGLTGYIDNPLFISANTADVSYQVAPDDAGLSDSTWYHIVVVQRGHNDTLYMYVNNVRETLTSGAGGIFSGTVGGTDDALRFGNSVAGAPWYLDGILDEIGIWKRELTPAEVGQLYNGGLGKTHPFN